MADRGDTHYHIPTLNNWFLISSLLLLVSIVWMVVEDWNAPWKAYQREFRAIELERANAELEQPEFVAAAEREDVLRGELEVAQAELDGRAEEIAVAKEELRVLKGQQFVDTEEAKGAKMFYNWERFEFDHKVAKHGGEPAYAQEIADDEASLAEFELAMNVAAGVQETTDLAVSAQQEGLAQLTEVVDDLKKSMKGAVKDLDLIRARKDDIDPEAFDKQIAHVLRDFPGIDFIGPNMKVNKVVLDDLTFELNFTRKTRIDMCQTCHLASNREGYEGEAEPFRSHPRLDLYLSTKSPHPMTEVGCTICHRGSGEALDFIRSDHRPISNGPAAWMSDREEWQDEHHWHKQHHWDYPMLAKDYTEASCVQCHKSSMELIAEDAPRVTEGYRLFERYGCYSCHKVDWFPNKRKPGPSLKNVASKLEADFVDSWIAAPRSFRPTTWMPQIFHLENYAPEEVVVTSDYGNGRDIMGQEWNESAVAAVSTYIMKSSGELDMEPIPMEGDAERGREVFRVAGCLACHNMAPYGGLRKEDPNDPALERMGENEHGPNLRGVATKVNAEWLYNWIKDPQKYWGETRMPNLRLSDQEASDVTAYMMEDPDGIFTETPEGWEAAPSRVDMETLREQARWFFSRDGRAVLEARFAGDDAQHRWDQEDELLMAVGEKYVRNQGCYSCHEIKGMEKDMPIGVELTNWGSKTTDKLDWGSIAEQLAHEHGWSQVGRDEFSHYREGWIEQKLAEPRSFDRDKVKNPTEKLRMPWFDFEPQEIRSIATFVVGLVDDEVELAKMEPTADQAKMDAGMRAVRQHNCAACHMIAPGTVSFTDEDGHHFTVPGEIQALYDGATPPVHSTLASLQEDIEAGDDYGDPIEELVVRLWDTVPGVGMPFSNTFIKPGALTGVEAPEGGDFVRTVVDYYLNGIETFDSEADEYDYWFLDKENGGVEDVDGALRSYIDEPYEKVRWTFAPPVLVDEGAKLQRDWFYEFLLEPVSLRQQMRVKMPTFNFEEGQAAAIVDYFALRSAKEWPASYAKKLRFTLGSERAADGVADGALDWPAAMHDFVSKEGDLSLAELSAASGISVADLEGIESGYQPSIDARFAALKAYGDAQGFRASGAPATSYERVERRSASYLEGPVALPLVGARVGIDGPKCFQCHFKEGEDDTTRLDGVLPIAWAPDLAHTRERLREEWTHDWLWWPSAIYPGTSMPANFAGNPPEWQEQFSGSDNADQVQAVLDWLYNFDQISLDTQN